MAEGFVWTTFILTLFFLNIKKNFSISNRKETSIMNLSTHHKFHQLRAQEQSYFLHLHPRHILLNYLEANTRHHTISPVNISHVYLLKYLFIYLAVLGLSCGMRDLIP